MLSKRPEFNVTMIDNSVLFQRLRAEIQFLAFEMKRAWPDLKRDPIGFVRHGVSELAQRLKRFVLAPNALAATATAILLVLSAVLTLILLRSAPRVIPPNGQDREEAEISMLNFPADAKPTEGTGVGARSNGRVGLAAGKGEGSESEPRQSRGGGGSGGLDPLPPTQGKVLPPSEIPAPINPPLPSPALPAAGIDIDPALYKNLPFANFGDPRSKATAESKGPGDGGGFGTGVGLGVGEGHDGGFGPGEKGNIGGESKDRGCCGGGGADGSNTNPEDINRVFTPPQVTQRARVTFKPEPQYSEEARKNQITGSVVLSVVFSRSGEVTNIRAIKPLPDGLTERAIAAARRIQFLPATKDGHPVNVHMQLEYNFNLY